MKRLSCIVLCAAVALTASRLLADTVYLKNGNKFEGEVIKETDDLVKLKTTIGTVTLQKEDIKRIEKGITSLQQYLNTAKTLKDDDTAGHCALGVWCKEHGLKKQSRDEFQKVVDANADHADAHKELGHVLQAGKWVTEEDAMKAKGFVLHEGRWITKTEADVIGEKAKEDEWKEKLRQAARKLEGSHPEEGKQVFESITPASTVNQAVVIAALRSVVEREGPIARQEAIRTLARLHAPDSFEAIVESILNEDKLEVTQVAVDELKGLNTKRAARALMKVLREIRGKINTATNEQKPELVQVIARASRALGLLGDEMAVPELAESVVVEVNYMRPITSTASTAGMSSSTLQPGGRINGVPIEIPRTSSVSISSGRPDEELVKNYYCEEARTALHQMTGQRFDFERKKWLQWWAANKPVIEPEEKEFEL